MADKNLCFTKNFDKTKPFFIMKLQTLTFNERIKIANKFIFLKILSNSLMVGIIAIKNDRIFIINLHVTGMFVTLNDMY
ncbi:hypothetical protein C7K42_06690 [Tetragenococcus halophilus subsp. halophilus DSM 20339]|nr:hypothetical protein C7K42_06690 [Tetragenococcus halophilus subsp. halophilus DSM 20339]